MNTKLLMTSCAIVLGVLGVIASFAPQEILHYAGTEPTGSSPLAIQILGALYLGFAMMNWMSKGIIIGGIYARPLATGNFVHFLIGAIALVKGATAIHELNGLWIVSGIYILLAICFGKVLFGHPITDKK